MSTEPIETEQPVVEVPVAVETPVEVPELVYNYQPTDDIGRPLGGKQVIKYRTSDELAQKLTEQNILLIRKLREETKKNRLGIADVEDIPDDAVRQRTNDADFEVRTLSPDERVKLSRDLLDPERFEEATSTLFEATVGAKPEALRHTLKRQQDTIERMEAVQEADAWARNTQEFYSCKENWETLCNWIAKNKLAPVRDNFQRAYIKLTAAGLLLEAPIVREEAPVSPLVQAPSPEVTPAVEAESTPEVTELTPANTQPVQVEPSRITTEEPAQQTRPVVRIPSGLTRKQANNAGEPRPVGDDIVYEVFNRDGKGRPTGEKKVYKGMAAVNAMPSDEMKRRIKSDPAFAKKVDDLLAAAAKKR